MPDPDRRPAYYAARSGGWRDWWTLLHPPYTAWHLSYVVIGASLAPELDVTRLVATLLGFFAAVGLSASCPRRVAWTATGHQHPERRVGGSDGGRSHRGRGTWGRWGGPGRVGAGPVHRGRTAARRGLQRGLFGGIVHTDGGFAAAWGAFPLLTAYVAQAKGLGAAAVLGGVAAFALSYAERSLSKPARFLRRQAKACTDRSCSPTARLVFGREGAAGPP